MRGRPTNKTGWRSTGLVTALATICAVRAPAHAGQLAIAWNESDATTGVVQSFRTRSPWRARGGRFETGPDIALAYEFGKLFVVSRRGGTIAVLGRRRTEPERVFDLGVGSEPEDIAVASPRTAWVTRRRATHLLRLDLRTGDTAEAVDLSPFADDDGLPDLGSMIIHEGRVFVQIRRMNEKAPGGLAAPGYLAVVDLATGQLEDVDPDAAGTQAIELQGTAAKGRMQIVEETRQLFVNASGGFFDAGGIEVIDLDTLRSNGLVIREADGMTGADLNTFVMVTSERGFVVYSTDFDLSSHLKPFTVSGGVPPGPELHVSVGYFVPNLELDPRKKTLFVPEGAFGRQGVLVFDASTGEPLTPARIPTRGPPTDVLVLDRR